MKRLFYHSLRRAFPEGIFRLVKGAASYSQRALVFTTPERDDVVFVEIAPEHEMLWPLPARDILEEQGLGPKRENLLRVDFHPQRSLKENLKNPLNRKAIEFLQNREIDCISPFTGKNSSVCEIADFLNLRIECATSKNKDPKDNPAYHAEDSLTLIELGGEDTPFGFAFSSIDEAKEKFNVLKKSKHFTGKALMKVSRQTASGVLSTIIEHVDQIEKYFSHHPDHIHDLNRDGGTIVTWYDDVVCSPSINMTVEKNGDITVDFISMQIFEDNHIEPGVDGTKIHRGNFYPADISRGQQDTIQEKAILLAKKIYEKIGYWGKIGMDTIILSDGRILITEVNPRVTGARYGFHPMMNTIGDGSFYLRNEFFDKRISYPQLFSFLKKKQILYTPDRGYGLVIFNTYPGKFTGLSLAPDPEKAKWVSKYIDDLLRNYTS